MELFWLQKFWNESFIKKTSFLSIAVKQMQPTSTLHCRKLAQNIKIGISCDERVYTWKIILYTIEWIKFMFISAIWNLSLQQGQQSFPIPRATKIKMESSVKKKKCFAWNGQNNLWGCFYIYEKKGCFVVLKPFGDGLQVAKNLHFTPIPLLWTGFRLISIRNAKNEFCK